MEVPPPLPKQPEETAAKETKSESTRPIKVCRVCGQLAFGFNFGGLSCESCKTFFRRCVLVNIKEPICKHKQQCVINVKTRRFCSACRFQKCLAIGMKTEALVDNKKKPKSITPRVKEIGCDRLLSTQSVRPLTLYEHKCIDQVNQISAESFPNEQNYPLLGQFATLLDCFNVLALYVKKYADFAKNLEPFRAMCAAHQVSLLKNVFVTNLSFYKTFIFDLQLKGAPLFKNEESTCCLFFAYQSLLKDKIEPEQIDHLTKCVHRLHQEMENDMTMVNLFHVSLLFETVSSQSQSDDGECREYLLYYRHYYRHLLRCYLACKYQSMELSVHKINRLVQATSAVARIIHFIIPRALGVIDSSQIHHLTVEILNLL